MSPKLVNCSYDDYLASFDKFGIHLGLERIEQLLDALSNPHERVPIIHVAGTNGKGSVCAFLLSILQEAGYRVGRYTSPHLLDWRERLTINGEWISDRDLIVALSQVQSAINPALPPTQFEVITAAMWWYFADQQVDIAVIETGLGGRLDATNVCDRPLVAVITSIGLDHCQQLGNTLEAIAFEKAGIMKPHCPVVIAENEPAVMLTLQAQATQCQAHLTCIEAAQPTILGAMWRGLEYELPLLGQHQLINSALAIAVIEQIRKQGWEISDRAIQRGIAQTQWAGRLQWLDLPWQGQTRSILIDGAHNPSAAKYLRTFVDQHFPDQRLIWIIGILNTKDQQGILQALLDPDDMLIVLPVANPATTPPEVLANIAQDFLNQPPQVCHDLQSALAAAFQIQQPTDKIILCGSLYLVSEILSTKFN
jgi:dihydrofolate synthase/folylpolyglutamate synthase